PLTTVRQPIRLLGFIAEELLLNILEGAGGNRQLVLPAELVVRGSCGAIRQDGGER
ncbi:substrate-binding domain-containing protein, partial [Candidatus Bipolaricaulota bacterium]|nr:substrate-binding domain-containing protein [Candidatus Bipolaricaulota bacterium]